MNRQDCGNTGATGSTTVQDSVFDLFQTAAMLLGEEQEAVSVIEEVVASSYNEPCVDPAVAHGEADLLNAKLGDLIADPAAAHCKARERVILASLERIGRLAPGALNAEAAAGSISPGTCIESDDLSAAGLTPEQLGALIDGPGRLRQWLDRLSPAMRAVFVLRAVLGRSNEATAEALRASGASGEEGWTGAAVSQVFRQALCSLATSLVSAAVPEDASAKA